MPGEKTTLINLGRWAVDSRRYTFSSSSGLVLPYSGTDGRNAAKEAELRKALAEGTVVLTAPLGTQGFITYNGDGFLPSFLRYGLKDLSLAELRAKITPLFPEGNLASAIAVFFRNENVRLKAKAEKNRLQEESQKSDNWTAPLKIMIPDIGTQLIVSKNWTFDLHQESRNDSIITLFNLFGGRTHTPFDEATPAPKKVTILRGSTLIIDRIYVRQQSKGYSSLSFFLQPQGQLQYGGQSVTTSRRMRFWAKLTDVNQMVASVNRLTVAGV